MQAQVKPPTKAVEVIDPERAKWDGKYLPLGRVVELPPMVAEWWIAHGLARIPETRPEIKAESRTSDPPPVRAGETDEPKNIPPTRNPASGGTRGASRPKAASAPRSAG